MLPVESESSDGWSMGQVREECNRHFEVAHDFGSLDTLHDAFFGRSEPTIDFY
jgi:hypothetical protein